MDKSKRWKRVEIPVPSPEPGAILSMRGCELDDDGAVTRSLPPLTAYESYSFYPPKIWESSDG